MGWFIAVFVFDVALLPAGYSRLLLRFAINNVQQETSTLAAHTHAQKEASRRKPRESREKKKRLPGTTVIVYTESYLQCAPTSTLTSVYSTCCPCSTPLLPSSHRPARPRAAQTASTPTTGSSTGPSEFLVLFFVGKRRSNFARLTLLLMTSTCQIPWIA